MIKRTIAIRIPAIPLLEPDRIIAIKADVDVIKRNIYDF